MNSKFFIDDKREGKDHIISLTDKLKEEYSPITSLSIIGIAKDLGGVKQVVKTPLIGDKSCLLYGQDKEGYIFYWSTLPYCERFNLAHETGHALLHSEIEGKTTAREGLQFEMEADLFATRLCDIPRLLPYFYQYTLSSFAEYGTKVKNLFRKNREIERLRDLGAYDVLVYNEIIGDNGGKK